MYNYHNWNQLQVVLREQSFAQSNGVGKLQIKT